MEVSWGSFTPLLDEADPVDLIDVVDAEGEPSNIFRYEKGKFLYDKLPIKMSLHQIGVQEVLNLSDLHGRTPERISLFGIIPASYYSGVELSPAIKTKRPKLAELVVEELCTAGHGVVKLAGRSCGRTCKQKGSFSSYAVGLKGSFVLISGCKKDY